MISIRSFLNCFRSPRSSNTPAEEPTPPSNQPTPLFKATVTDIEAVHRTLLQLGLPTEIIAVVFEFAEYWCVQRFEQHTPLSLGLKYGPRRFRAGETMPIETSSFYFQTAAIGHGTGFDRFTSAEPRKVTFRITSRADNDSMAIGRVGTYLNNTSWFDAAIIREDDSWTGKMQEPIEAIHNQQLDGQDHNSMFYYGSDPFTLPSWFCRDEEHTKLMGGFKIVPRGRRLMWLLQRNRVDSGEFETKTIEWRDAISKDYKEVGERWWTDDMDPDRAYVDPTGFDPPIDVRGHTYWRNGISGNGEVAEEEEWPVDGSGSGENFVKSLERGDRIGVWARTLWVGSENHIQSIDIDVYFSVL